MWLNRMLGNEDAVELAVLFYDVSTLQRMSLRRSTHWASTRYLGGSEADALSVKRLGDRLSKRGESP